MSPLWCFAGSQMTYCCHPGFFKGLTLLTATILSDYRDGRKARSQCTLMVAVKGVYTLFWETVRKTLRERCSLSKHHRKTLLRCTLRWFRFGETAFSSSNCCFVRDFQPARALINVRSCATDVGVSEGSNIQPKSYCNSPNRCTETKLVQEKQEENIFSIFSSVLPKTRCIFWKWLKQVMTIVLI